MASAKRHCTIICPITLESIDDPVRTVVGTMYEREAIREWLKTSSIDPCTGLVLPYKTLIPVEPGTEHMSAQDFCLSDAMSWTRQSPFYWSVKARNESPTSDTLNSPIYSKAMWNDMIAFPTKHYAPSLYGEQHEFYTELERCLNIIRYPDTGCGLEQLDLSNVTMVGKSIKGVSFKGSKFPPLVLGMTFNRCNMSFTDLRGTTFRSCVFVGEQTVFTMCKKDDATRFENCQFEDGNWKLQRPNERVEESLTLRGFPK